MLIYVESLETTYSDKKIFSLDLLHELTRLKSNHISFSSYKQMSGTGWTIAGIVSTQCGIPLKQLTIFGKNREGGMVSNFLPQATCLGDILADQGYYNVFMNGVSAKFDGEDKFFEDHHYNEIYGKKQWLDQGIPEAEMSGWGLHDDDLFNFAKLKLEKLISEQRLFNLTIQTIDTHGHEGVLSNTCKKPGFVDFEGIVECTANQLADFVNFVDKKGWLNKVSIVIVGDHLAMRNVVYDKISQEKNRSIYNLIVTKQHRRKNTDEIVHFDILPTILDVIGIHYHGQQLGLGYSALAPYSIKPVNRISDMQEGLDQHSEYYSIL